jgi:periplasmic protein TonB
LSAGGHAWVAEMTAASVAPVSASDRLGFALFIAVALHALLILGVGFAVPRSSDLPRQLEVTLSVRSSSTPVEARHMAAEDQIGSGEEAEVTRFTSTQRSPQSANEQSAPQAQETELRMSDAQESSGQQARAALRPSPDARRPRPEREPVTPSEQSEAVAAFTLEAQLATEQHSDSTEPRVRRIHAVAAQRAEDAAYLLAWRNRIEDVGNRFYPEASRRYGIYGSLELLTVIDYRGTLIDVQLLRSSGFAVLDEAAVRIVRIAAPYPAFPPELRATADRLEIIRTWQFQDNALQADLR